MLTVHRLWKFTGQVWSLIRKGAPEHLTQVWSRRVVKTWRSPWDSYLAPGNFTGPGETQVNNYLARLSMPALYLPPRHIATGPSERIVWKDCSIPGTLRKLKSFTAEALAGCLHQEWLRSFKASLVSLGELEPKAQFTLRDSESPAASRMRLWISTLRPSGAILQGQYVRRSNPQASTGIISAHLFTILLLFSAGATLLMPVYFNMDSIQVMYHRRYWEVSNSDCFSRARSGWYKKGKG